jgi:amino acid permease
MLFPLLCQQGEARKALEVLQRRNVPVDLVVHNSVLSMICFLTSKFRAISTLLNLLICFLSV